MLQQRLSFLTVAVLLTAVATAYYVPENGTTVQLFEWSWADIANECETFLGPKGNSLSTRI